LLVVSYGGGVNTIAVLVVLANAGLRPHAIVMADPGSERASTIDYRELVARPFLARVGFPDVTVIERRDEAKHRPRAWRFETLRSELERTKNLPSIAYGPKKCSAKYKGEAQRWWSQRQEWARAEWSAGRKLVRVIGYDIDEMRRVRGVDSPLTWEPNAFAAWYPLVDLKMDRDDCARAIAAAGLPVPEKSACYFCPSNTLEEWQTLRRENPVLFADAVRMSQEAEAAGKIENPDRAGLMLCNKTGKRQLHVWAAGGYDNDGPLFARVYDEEDAREAMPCECAT
jgi:hypothetical protein